VIRAEARADGGEEFFRLYGDEDLTRCSEIAAQAWPEVYSFAKEGKPLVAMQAYVDFNRASATWQEVACASGKVVGLLFGRVDSELTLTRRFGAYLKEMLVYAKLFFGLYGKISGRVELIKRGMEDDRAKARNSPESDGEVTFFVVDKEQRGKGIGRSLMDHYIVYARQKGAKRIMVYTSDPGCNWAFYEKYGFVHRSSQPDAFSSFTMNQKVTGLIFSIDL
jgi:ribosomal protein S18 acetylase RimI-like enzyme